MIGSSFALDAIVIAAYFALILSIGLWMSRGSKTLVGFALGNRQTPWWAVLASILAAEISAATFLGAPESGYSLGNWTYAQFAIGTVLARIIVSFLFIPLYYRQGVISLYEFLETRFGPATRRCASATFLVTRVLAMGTRLYVSAIIIVLAWQIWRGAGIAPSEKFWVFAGAVVLVTLLTAIYMFRLVFLAFHGERSDNVAADTSSQQPPGTSHQAPATSHHLHDAPPAMALALIVLAIGSVVAGYVSLGGRLEHFLEPSFAVAQDGGGIAAGLVSETIDGVDIERILMGLSIVAAFSGIGIAAFYFLRSRTAADGIARAFAGLHRVLLNKYYVDEVYDATIVQPIHIVSKDALWKIVDVRVLDGAVNGVGETVGGLSEVLRRLQTGSVRAYAASIFFGAVLIVGYYLWR